MKFLERIQKLPKGERKIIFWLILIPFAIFLFFLYGKYFQNKIKSIQAEKIGESFEFPKLQEQLKKIPKIEIPTLK